MTFSTINVKIKYHLFYKDNMYSVLYSISNRYVLYIPIYRFFLFCDRCINKKKFIYQHLEFVFQYQLYNWLAQN